MKLRVERFIDGTSVAFLVRRIGLVICHSHVFGPHPSHAKVVKRGEKRLRRMLGRALVKGTSLRAAPCLL